MNDSRSFPKTPKQYSKCLNRFTPPFGNSSMPRNRTWAIRERDKYMCRLETRPTILHKELCALHCRRVELEMGQGKRQRGRAPCPDCPLCLEENPIAVLESFTQPCYCLPRREKGPPGPRSPVRGNVVWQLLVARSKKTCKLGIWYCP